MKTIDEYKALLKAEEEKITRLKGEYDEASRIFDQASGAFSDAESEERSAQFAVTAHKLNKTWMILMGIALAFDVVIPFYGLYWMKIDGTFFAALGHNGVPAILAVVSLILWILGTIFYFKGRKEGQALAGTLADASLKAKDALAVKEEKESIKQEALGKLEQVKAAQKKLLEEYYAAYPEEFEKVRAKEKSKEEAARREYEEKLASERLAAEKAIQRQKDLTEAQKMFEHPQAYIMDGQFENDFQVFLKAAEMGCEEAQIRVVETYLGISYKHGVKVDVAKGEEVALSFVEGGSFVFYEILGKGYLYGEGSMPTDEAKGLKYLEKRQERADRRP